MTTSNPPINSISISVIPDRYTPSPGKYEGDIGLDIPILQDLEIGPGEPVFIDGGFRVQFGRGWAGLVLPRSSSNRRGLHIHTAVIDNGYTGTIGAFVRNLTRMPIELVEGERIAQLVLIPAFRPDPVVVTEFLPTDRGENGWGSSGT